MGGRLLKNLILSAVVAAVFLYLAFRNVPFVELGAALERFDTRWLVPALAISFLLMVMRAWRWQLELRPLAHIGLGRLWVVCSVAYMAINLLPVRLGEVVRPWLLSRRSRVSISNVVGNLVVEKTMDSIAIVFYILVGLLTAADLPPWVRHGAWFPAIAAVLLAALVVLLWLKGEPFVDRWVVRYLPHGFGGGLKRVTGAIIDGMRVLPDGRLLLSVFVASIALWLLPILSSWVIIRAFNFNVPFNAALIVFIFIGFGTALPNAPGMIGTYQYACVLALGLFGVAQADALAYGLVLNALQLVSIIAQGLVAYPFAGISVDDFRRVRGELQAEL
ncbi:MAG TPA: lysylphosphatidylglycerol synthase transmembrane domain-containing protein [Candidatus Margulisiibacteriota bacterium]|nr:lysylphosphatidylglycerol synthase transmembrane domain-containing protein [Candidatus Margulisiibacteriota bacterium]